MAEPLYTLDDVIAGTQARFAHYKAERGITGNTYLWEGMEPEVRVILDATVPAILARELRAQAESTIREAVCCDEYEAFKAGVPRPKYAHHICYWGAAHAEALRRRATEIEADQ